MGRDANLWRSKICPTPPPPLMSLHRDLWCRTLYAVLNEVHTIKIRFYHGNDETIIVSD